jgi:hypothetical protein
MIFMETLRTITPLLDAMSVEVAGINSYQIYMALPDSPCDTRVKFVHWLTWPYRDI